MQCTSELIHGKLLQRIYLGQELAHNIWKSSPRIRVCVYSTRDGTKPDKVLQMTSKGKFGMTFQQLKQK